MKQNAAIYAPLLKYLARHGLLEEVIAFDPPSEDDVLLLGHQKTVSKLTASRSRPLKANRRMFYVATGAILLSAACAFFLLRTPHTEPRPASATNAPTGIAEKTEAGALSDDSLDGKVYAAAPGFAALARHTAALNTDPNRPIAPSDPVKTATEVPAPVADTKLTQGPLPPSMAVSAVPQPFQTLELPKGAPNTPPPIPKLDTSGAAATPTPSSPATASDRGSEPVDKLIVLEGVPPTPSTVQPIFAKQPYGAAGGVTALRPDGRGLIILDPQTRKHRQINIGDKMPNGATLQSVNSTQHQIGTSQGNVQFE